MKCRQFVQIGVLLCWWTIGLVLAGTKKSIIDLSRCRVDCLKQIPSIATDKSCSYSPECHSCWEVCKNLFTSYTVWKPICNNEICKTGCQTACHFIKTRPKVKKSDLNWEFLEDVSVTSDSLNTLIQWTRPITQTPLKDKSPFVYTLMARNASWQDKNWHQYIQQASEEVSLKRDELPYVPEFKLVAVNDEGLVAEVKFKPNFNVIGVLPSPELTGGLKEHPGSSMMVDTKFNISYNTTELRNGELEMEITWQHPNLNGQPDDVVFYDVHWFLSTCNKYDGMPPCDHPPEHKQATCPFRQNEQPYRIIKRLLYNSEYMVRVELQTDVDINSFIMLATPKCETPDYTFTKCIRLTREEEIAEQNSLRELDSLLWHLNYTSKIFNPNTYTVDINITWSPPFNQSAVNYSIAWEMAGNDDYFLTGLQKANQNYYVLSLEPDSFFRVRADAQYLTDAGQPTIYDSQWLYINTSDFTVDDQPMAVHMKKKHDDDALRGVITAVVCIFSIVVVGLVSLFIYRKRHSFKDIIITKSTVAKSNSYKSNVGAGKSDYSNQLMIISDEWELDPRQLKFCATIGQGAFGKVVTGYYNDKKVAIKLVKEGAPLSYKEDLVAEISLMKRIGHHPNIVSMIGACTICEPVALIMEFIPHGNLQTFLKKCRMEGDFRKRTDGQSEIIYSLVEDSGGIDNGVIVPSDMLSFARQVAMAMEYMAEKKYVHRDLAARNVLLHHNKIVKVCDFGLSRDIYNDNEYKKLTNGKLPLKWMAIESLRDRIFTTHTDVWSFGILLWEIVTMGASPYPNIALADLYYILSNGYRMEKPSNCSEELYRIMRQCWEDNPADRPSFTTIRLMLEELLEQDCDYLLLDNIDVPLNMSENSSNPIDSTQQDGGATGSTGATGSSSPAPAPPRQLYTGRRDKNLKVNVCVHDQSTERLIYRPSESDSTTSSP